MADKHPLSRRAMKAAAQESLMHGIANAIGYFTEMYVPQGWSDWTEEQRDEYRTIMQREADRVARLFGFEKAWSN
ncbi:hypothetical protein [Streptomyces tsukubensis]|uniref:hypothetical protein n=1 Tax=Streptomyces tsukubensis TaxID=83656 RepID=UPI00344B2E5E